MQHLVSIPNFNRINEWPLQFLRTGSYGRSYGSLYGRTTDGRWWSNAASSVTNGRYLDSWVDNVYAQNSTFRGLGFARRCGENELVMVLQVRPINNRDKNVIKVVDKRKYGICVVKCADGV